MGMRIDEPRHNNFARQLYGGEMRGALNDARRWGCGGAGSVTDDDCVARLRTVAQQYLIGDQQLFARLQALGGQIVVHGSGFGWRHWDCGVLAGLISGAGWAGGGAPAARLRAPRWWKRM